MTIVTKKVDPAASSEQLERLREAWVADIELLEKMGQEVIVIRRRWREALQQLDVLIQRCAYLESSAAAKDIALEEKDAAISAKDVAISEKDALIMKLEAELAAVLAARAHE